MPRRPRRALEAFSTFLAFPDQGRDATEGRCRGPRGAASEGGGTKGAIMSACGDRPWPAAMRERTAAAYLDLSPSTFRAHIAPQLQAVWLTSGCKGYLRQDLDTWLLRKAQAAAVEATVAATPDRPQAAFEDPVAAALAALGPSNRRARRVRGR